MAGAFFIFKRMRARLFCVLVLTFILSSLGFSQKNKENSKLYLDLKIQIENRNEFDFQAEWVNSVNLVTAPNTFKFSWESARIDLPYFGVIQNAISYSPTDVGLNFEGVPKNVKTTFKDKKQFIRLEFKTDQPRVSRKYTMELYPNGRASMVVSSSDREAVRYRGNFKFKKKQN